MSTEWYLGIGITAAITVIVGAVIYYLQHRPRRLDYALLADSDLLAKELSDVDVAVKGVRAERPRLFRIRFHNSGRSAIRPGDFEVPLTVGLGAPVLKHDIADKRPSNLNDAVKLADVDGLMIEPLLLNRGDWFEIEGLVDSDELALSVEGRIADVSIRDRTLEEHDPSKRGVLVPQWFGVFMVFAVFGVFVASGFVAVSAFEAQQQQDELLTQNEVLIETIGILIAHSQGDVDATEAMEDLVDFLEDLEDLE